MKLPSYAQHPTVIEALENLYEALSKVLREGDNDLKSVAIYILPDQGRNAGVLMGCHCDGCKASLLKSAAIVCGADSSEHQALTPDAPIQAMH